MKDALPQLVVVSPLPEAETRRQAERLAAELAVEVALGYNTPIGHTAEGAPYIEGHPQLHISLSHSGDTLVLALSNDAPVGVDVEYDSPRVARVVPRVMTPDEAGLPSLEVWCAKEAVFKCALEPRRFLAEVTVAPDLSHAVLGGRRFALEYVERGPRCIVIATEQP